MSQFVEYTPYSYTLNALHPPFNFPLLPGMYFLPHLTLRNFTSSSRLTSCRVHHPSDLYDLDFPSLRQFFPLSSPFHVNDLFGGDFKFASFRDLQTFARQRFNLIDLHSRAISAAAVAPTVDFHQVCEDSHSFEQDPISTIESHASISAAHRLNAEFLSNASFDSFTDISLLRSIASEVCPIFDPAFQPSLCNAEIRQQILSLQPAILALFQTNYVKGEVLLVTKDSFVSTSLRSGFAASLSNIWHTEKFMNDLGRLLYDYTNLSNGTPVNSDTCRDLYRAKYGKLVYPTVSDYISMLWSSRLSFPHQSILITKSDVHRAYHRFRWSASGSLLLSLLISDNLVAIPITGGFGSNGPPFIYDVVSRFLQFQHDLRMTSLHIPHRLGGIYVDDFAFFGPKPFADSELSTHESLVNSLLGPSAAHRSEQSHSLDIIGVRFDTTLDTVGISPKGYLKLIYFFFTVLPSNLSPTQRFPLSVFQTLAGLTNRYGFFIPLLRHSSHVFYRLLRGPSRTHTRRFTRVSLPFVKLWRSFLIHAFSYSRILSTPCSDYFHNCSESYNPLLLVSQYSSYSDATLHTLGLFVPCMGWCQIEVSEFATVPVSIALLEFIAFILSFLFAHHLNPHARHIHLYIDNQNAESWSRGHFHSDSNVVLTFVTLNSILQSTLAIIQTRAYVRSEHNVVADSISRKCYLNSDHIPKYLVTSPILKFLRKLLDFPDPDPFVIHHDLLTALQSDVFCPTSN